MTMNLSGRLDAFGLDEVLSLLAMGGRTARVHVAGPTGAGAINLVDGDVSSATADLSRAALLRQLVAGASVSARDLAVALDSAEPVAALVDSGVVDRGLAHEVAVEQVVDSLGEMLAWSEGEFAVWTGAADPADIGVRLPVHEAVERGRSRVSEWSRVRAALPGEDTVLALAPDVAEGFGLAVEDWSVLARVDGRRTLAEVVSAVGAAPLAASDRLAQLIGRGLVHVRPQEAAEVDEVADLLDGFEGGAGAGSDVTLAVTTPVVTVAPVAVAVPDVDVEPPGVDAVPSVVVDEGAVDEVLTADDSPVVEDPSALAVADQVPGLLLDELIEPVSWEPQGQDLLVDDVIDPTVTWDLSGATEASEPAPEPAPEPLGHDVHDVPAVLLDEPVAELAPRPVPYSLPAEVDAPVWDVAEPVATSVAEEAPVAPGVQWSPWAQALGLGAPAPEGELIVDPLAGPGIREMIADAHGLIETEHVPVPQVPVAPDATEAPGVPAPREAEGQTWSVEQAEVAVGAADQAAEPSGAGEADVDAVDESVPALAPHSESAADPLSGGLLAQLMSGVRGL